ncbi:LOW QUALITY PROTEIN: hypothetical protein CVT26_013529 [Gymnopilus dilepis]|uniref:Uncharacterized protein n=1 Tax=Gymnopilus dilepis TaxID=231916 RepID=A0A409Y5M8_9AGAR|nr:LOW QUALITY PROTEIN: hypothetical protein CVT26_013529 [Gymnopilus dilepis]
MSPNERYDTKQTIHDIDWKTLEQGIVFSIRTIYPRPGLLNAKKENLFPFEDERSLPDDQAVHKDEQQVGLDTYCSSVLHSADGNGLYRDKYHDIENVFFLTLPEELRLVCVERLSPHRLKDSMGVCVEPVLVLLRSKRYSGVTEYLLCLADPDFAEVLERYVKENHIVQGYQLTLWYCRSSWLPICALSDLLTLFRLMCPPCPHRTIYKAAAVGCIPHILNCADTFCRLGIILSRKNFYVWKKMMKMHSLSRNFTNLVDVQVLEFAKDFIHRSKLGDSLDDNHYPFFKDEQDTQGFSQSPSDPDPEEDTAHSLMK